MVVVDPVKPSVDSLMIGLPHPPGKGFIAFGYGDVFVLLQVFTESCGMLAEDGLTRRIISEKVIICQITCIVGGHFDLTGIDN